MKKISVIVPVYNEEKYLDRCIESICNQSYKNLEIIIVDDGSRKSCADKCDEYTKLDNRIRVIHKENGRLVSARKAGILAASGQYVMSIDADDWIEPRLCEEYFKVMSYEPDMIVSTNYYRDYKNGKMEEVFHNEREGFWEAERFETDILPNFVKTMEYYDTEFPIGFCFYAFKRDKMLAWIRDWDDKLIVGVDTPLMFTAYTNAKSFAAIPYRGYHYQMQQGSMTSFRQDAKEQYKITYESVSKQIEKSSYNHTMLYKKRDVLLYHSLMVWNFKEILKISDDYLHPYSKVKRGSSVIIYGAGRIGESLYKALKDSKNYKLVGITDKNYMDYEQNDYRIMAPEKIVDYDYDYVLLAISFVNMRIDAKESLLRIGVEESKIAEIDINVFDASLIYND